MLRGDRTRNKLRKTSNRLRTILKSWRTCILLAFLGACAGIQYHLDFIRITTGRILTDLPSTLYYSSWVFSGLFFPAVVASFCGIGILVEKFPNVTLHPLPGPLEKHATTESAITQAILTGAILGLFLMVLIPVSDLFITVVSNNDVGSLVDRIDSYKAFLIACSAGIIEELQYRLGLMTLFLYLGTIFTRETYPGRGVFWAANLLAVVPFGLLHLYNVIALGGSLTPAVVGIVLVWNGVAGLGFGLLYWKKGLAAAITGHITMDIFLKVLAPLIFV